ncbi:MAG: hypothetical protein EPO25_05200 [Gammaproteobacteria bacterium]|nr:MAG: hypothetical protein EPO25_05200 [Gammaproteobacteria bacterium]
MNNKLYQIAFMWLFLLALPARADIEWIHGAVAASDFRKTTIPFLQGKTTTYELKGEWMDWVDKVEGLGTGMTVSKLEKHFPLKSLTLALNMTATATPGSRRLTLVTNRLNVFGQWERTVRATLDIYVVRAGSFNPPADVQLPSYFTEATVALNGTNIGNAGVDAAGWPSGTTASVSSSTSASAVVALRFTSPQAQVAGDLRLYDKGQPLAFMRNLPGTYAYKVSGTTATLARLTLKGPNSLSSITFPAATQCGTRCYEWGNNATIRLNFLRAVRPEGETVSWLLSPSTRADGHRLAQAIAPTVYDPAAKSNSLIVGSGATSTDLVVKVCSCPTNSSVITVTAWVNSTSSSPAPSHLTNTFAVSCPSGISGSPRC